MNSFLISVRTYEFLIFPPNLLDRQTKVIKNHNYLPRDPKKEKEKKVDASCTVSYTQTVPYTKDR